jgi:hypothetical protein
MAVRRAHAESFAEVLLAVGTACGCVCGGLAADEVEEEVDGVPDFDDEVPWGRNDQKGECK